MFQETSATVPVTTQGRWDAASTRFFEFVFPSLFFLNVLTLLFLPRVSALPHSLKLTLLGYAASLILPALWTPQPVLSVALAVVKVGLTAAAIALGWCSRERPDRNRLLLISITLVVVIALVWSFLFTRGISLRLSHPLLTTTSLAILCVVGVWLVFTGKRRSAVQRWGLLALFAGGLVLTGSREAVLALAVGVAAAMLAKASVGLWRSGFALLAGGTLLLFVLGSPLFARVDLSGREVIWLNTLSVIQGYPWTGIGSYQLGQVLRPDAASCTTFTSPTGVPFNCPEWLSHLGSPWLIAHNMLLQQYAESGPLGVAGLILLLTYFGARALRGCDEKYLAFLSGYLFINSFDNAFVVPSSGVAEIFWFVSGQCLMAADEPRSTDRFKALLLTFLPPMLPLLIYAVPSKRAETVTSAFITAAQTGGTNTLYTTFSGEGGVYRVVYRLCGQSCRTLRESDVHLQSAQAFTTTLTPVPRLASGEYLDIVVFGSRNLLDRVLPLSRVTWPSEAGR